MAIFAKGELNHHTEQKFLAEIWSVLKLRPYLYGDKFTVRTDQNEGK